MKYEQKSSDKLFSKAKELIPGGLFGHYKYAVRHEGPKFFSKAKDAYFWDVDGNKFIDLICGWGPMILGYNNPIIDKAAQKQYSLGNTVSVASPVMIELAETLVDTVEIAEWALFGKNGGDSTQLAVMISRQETGKDKVLKINGGYHGANGWMQREGSPGTIDSDSSEVISIPWNNIEEFDSVISKFENEIACFISSPFHHPTSEDNVLPKKGYWEHIQKVCNEKNIIIIVDDVRTGFRIDLAGSNNAFNFSPDLVCLGKAIANGYPISALVGKNYLKESANKVYFSGTQFFNSAPMAAAIATINELKKIDATSLMNHHGNDLKSKMISMAKSYDIDLKVTGVPSMPYFRIENEDQELHFKWVDNCLSKGIYMTSYHNHFLSAVHRESEIDLIVNLASKALEDVIEV